MEKMIIKGGNKLSGTIKVSGMKNSVVALIPAAILSDSVVTIDNVPHISDTDSLIDILNFLNAKVDFANETMKINSSNLQNLTIPEKYSNKLRASYYFMGALLGKYNSVEIYFPGGCNIGARPIDIHIKAFEALGAKVDIDGDKYKITADELIGTEISFDFASVGATINTMLAAVKAKGKTIINNAAKEPEIVNIATLLNNMGAKITGAGTSEIHITGVKKLGDAVIEVLPDRIEAGTYIIAGALIGDNLKIEGLIKEHVEALTSKLKEIGIPLTITNNSIIISSTNDPKAVNIKTQVFPGFVTDLGQPIAPLLTQCEGLSHFEETIYENRMSHIKCLNKMGANITVNGTNAFFNGPTPLKGQEVEATDLRAGASLVLAGLIAEGETTITNIEHILRGYENIVEKLKTCGANIEIIDIK